MRSKDRELLEFVANYFKSLGFKPKWRTVNTGYSVTQESYICSMPLRRIFEWFQEHLVEILSKCRRKVVYSYFAGLIDGDGSFDLKRHDLRISYSKKEVDKVLKDRTLLDILGWRSRIKKTEKCAILVVYKPTSFIKTISPFLLLSRKSLP